MSLRHRFVRRYRGPLTPGLAVGVAVAVAAHAVALWWLSSGWKWTPPPEQGLPYLSLARPSAANREFVELLDPSPLFLPTRHNHATVIGARGRGAPEDAPLPDRPEVTSAGALRVAPPRTPELSPEGVLGARIPDTAFGLGLRAPVTPPAGGARCEAVSESGVVLPLDLGPRRREELLSPAEFSVEVDAYGIQPLVLIAGTGDAAADGVLAARIREVFARMVPAPGRYRIVAAP